jgi:[ribosomal protein S18]-alanine N-acetyltransferase
MNFLQNVLQIRWLIRRDMDEVLAIKNGVVEWDEDEWLRHLKQRNCIGSVAESGGDVIGCMCYDLYLDRLHLLNMAVAADRRRVGIGTALIQRLLNKLALQRRNSITIDVPESAVDAQLFFRAVGFVATETNGDQITFNYRLPSHGELTTIGGKLCRRSTGYPLLVPEDF